MGVHNGALNSREMKKFRQDRNVKVSKRTVKAGRTERSPVTGERGFGKPNRPSTPIGGVI